MKIQCTVLLVCLFGAVSSFGQVDSVSNRSLNSVEQLLQQDGKLGIGGYGEVHFNQELSGDYKKLGTLDAHRVVLFVGYNFTKNTQFVTEIEAEHAHELDIEQAFMQQKINSFINLKAGLLLVPMGIINEYHEPNSFNGVERPMVDKRIAPSTWREIGAGFSGTVLSASLKYQAYILSGLNGYDGKAVFSGSSALRDGRQEGAEAYVSSPSFASKIEYFGVRGLNLGLSGFLGRSQSRLYDGLHRDSISQKAKADSSVVGVAMFGADVRYTLKGLEMRGQLYYVGLSNTKKYNQFTAEKGVANDLGSSMLGYYAEVAYNVFRFVKSTKTELVPFVRYEFYNTHNTVESTITQNKAYANTIITSGLTYRLTKKAVLKADIQFSKSSMSNEYTKIFNAGFGVMF